MFDIARKCGSRGWQRGGKVFIKGEYVVSGSKGVCVVEEVTTLDISGVDKKREYSILKPVYMAGSTVYVPVDTAEGSMRRVMDRETVQQLINGMADIAPIAATNDKLLEQEYRSCMKSNRCEEVLKVIKTIYLRKQKRLAAGRKVTAVDAKYFRIAEENLYGELAISLDMSRAEVERYITAELDKRADSPVCL